MARCRQARPGRRLPPRSGHGSAGRETEASTLAKQPQHGPQNDEDPTLSCIIRNYNLMTTAKPARFAILESVLEQAHPRMHFAHVLIGEPVSTPDQVGAGFRRDMR